MMLQSLFTTALGRVVPLMYQKVVRRTKVESALRGNIPANRAVQAAMTDYEVLVGSTYGQLTVSLDRFHRQLESSGIIIGMAEEAAVKKRTELTKQAFLALHRDVFQSNEGDGLALYNQMATAFEASLELLIADPAIALVFKSIAADLTQKLDRIEERTSAISLTLQPTGRNQDLSVSLQKVNKALAGQFKDIRVETNRGAKQVTIDRIFIPSKLRCRKEPEILKEILALDISTRRRDRFPGDSRNGTIIGYNEFRGSFRRAVILGDPGGGKSTLCQYLCHHMAKHYGLELQYPERRREGFEAQLLKVPLRVVLRSFESARVRNPQLGLFDFILNELRSATALPIIELEESLRHTLNYGNSVLAFDGLDEILNAGTRREFVDLVTNFCDQHPLCPVLVTSRIIGYEDAPLPDDYEEFTLERFDVSQVEQYVTNFLRVFLSVKEPIAAERAKQFIAQTEKNASDLRQNPLMLGLMAFLFASKEDVPSKSPGDIPRMRDAYV